MSLLDINRSQNYCLLCVDWLSYASFSKTSSFHCGRRASPPSPHQKLRLAGQKPCISGPGGFYYKFHPFCLKSSKNFAGEGRSGFLNS